MKKRKFAEGGSTVAGPSSGSGSPSMSGKRPTSADALRYFRATGNRAGADEILKAAVGKPAKMPEDYGSAFAKSGPSSSQSAGTAMLQRQKEGSRTPVGAVKPASSGIVSSSKEAFEKMPPMSVVPTIPGDRVPGGSRVSDAEMRAFESMARSTPQPGPRMPVGTPSPSLDRGPPKVAPGSSTPPTFSSGVSPPTFGRPAPPAPFAKGGKIDGCAQRGKTRGKVV